MPTLTEVSLGVAMFLWGTQHHMVVFLLVSMFECEHFRSLVTVSRC